MIREWGRVVQLPVLGKCKAMAVPLSSTTCTMVSAHFRLCIMRANGEKLENNINGKGD